jgi:hypothetical protein
MSKKVLLATRWILLIDWRGSGVSTQLSRDAIKGSPRTTAGFRYSVIFETELYACHGKAGYWL